MILLPQDDFESYARSDQLAQVFDRWRRLEKRLEDDPQSVDPEEITAAWEAVLEAHERWALGR